MFKNIILGIGIVVVYALVLWQGIEAFYPTPQYDDYCKSGRFESSYPKAYPYGYEQNCTFPAALREQETQCYAEKGQPVFDYDDNGCTVGFQACDFCNKEFEEAMDAHSKIVFIISIIIGVIVLIVGYSILSIEPVGSALIGGGIWAIFWGAAINWRNFSDIWRFLLLLVALILIIWFAIMLNRAAAQKKGFWQKLGIKK